MRICIRGGCHWEEAGFNSNVRGESRWGMNIALLLAKLGNDVTFLVDEVRSTCVAPYNIKVLIGPQIALEDVFDIYIDTSWGFTGGLVLANAKIVLGMAWFSCTYEIPSLIRLYPYTWVKDYDSYKSKNCDSSWEADPLAHNIKNNHVNSMLHLAIPLGEKFIDPEDNIRDSVLIPFKCVLSDEPRCNLAEKVFKNLNDRKIQTHVFSVDPTDFYKRFPRMDYISCSYGLTYDSVRELAKRSKLSIPFGGASCTIDAIFCGCATTVWKEMWYHQIASRHGLLVTDDNALDVINTLIDDSKRTNAYIRDFQYELSEHLDKNVEEQFNYIVKSLGV